MSTRKRWTRDAVLAQAKQVSIEIGHFPSCSELRAIGRNDLAVQLSRNGGFVAVAKEIGESRIHSDSDTGWDGEIAVAARLALLGFTVLRERAVRHPFDLLVNGCVRVDVKSASIATYGKCTGHFYRIGKTPTCDVVILYATDTGLCHVIPWNKVPRSNITITQTGKTYAQYRENWSLVTALTSALQPLAA